MLSMIREDVRCQAVPDAVSGVVVGVDVSKRKMDFAAFGREERSRRRSVKQDICGYSELKSVLEELRGRGYDPWVAFEPTGPYSTCLREWLLSSGEHVVQVNGYHVKRTKEVRDNSPNKNDGKDPRVIADLVWQGCYQQVVELPGEYAELRCSSAEWASLSKRKAALRNEFQSLLEVWFPELTQVFKDPLCKSARALVRRYRCVSSIASASLREIESELSKASRGRAVNRAEPIRLAALASIAPSGGQQSRYAAMVNLLDMLELVESMQERLRERMRVFLENVAESEYLLSVYGIGIITAAGLLGECGPLGRYRTFAQLEKFVGLNIYEVSSGQFRGQRHIAKRGRALARYLICQAAMQHVRSRGLFWDYAQALKAKGKKPGQIRVAVARKLLALLYALARDQEHFDRSCFFMGARMEDGLLAQQGTHARAA